MVVVVAVAVGPRTPRRRLFQLSCSYTPCSCVQCGGAGASCLPTYITCICWSCQQHMPHTKVPAGMATRHCTALLKPSFVVLLAPGAPEAAVWAATRAGAPATAAGRRRAWARGDIPWRRPGRREHRLRRAPVRVLQTSSGARRACTARAQAGAVGRSRTASSSCACGRAGWR